MIQKLKRICSILMVLILFMPSITKLEHQHENFVCHEKKEKHFHSFHEKCVICSFEFSIFLSAENGIVSTKVELTGIFDDRDNTFYYPDLSKYSFLLRAPPVFANS